MATLQHDITLVLGADFLSSFANLPRRIQTKVTKFIGGFKDNPTANSYNYETLHTRDKHLRSVRIDQDYRGIIYKPDSGDMYILTWVDKHDDAYAWAQNKVFQVHPVTGSLQMIDFSEIEPVRDVSSNSSTSSELDIFSEFRDRELISVGVPEAVIPFIRQMETEEDLEAAEGKIPQEAWEALYLLCAGESLQDVYNTVIQQESVDTSDIKTSLNNSDSQRRFVIITDDEELKDILSYPLDAWRVFLHPAQRKTVSINANGPVRVLGGAGTGKTVVAMHRAKWLIENVFTKSTDKILFTTYTKNLASDIKENLSTICTTDQLRKIEVVHINAWVSDFLRKRSFKYSYVTASESRDLWDEAYLLYDGDGELSVQFFKDEWTQIIQQQEISTEKAYLKAKRTGRGRSLKVNQRKSLWKVFTEYRQLLDDRLKFEYEDAARAVKHILLQSKDILPYRSVIVDEAQDLDVITFKLLHSIATNNSSNDMNQLFITGDSHQRIYGNKIVLSKCGLDIRGRSRRLKINYRTPEEIRSWAQNILENSEFDDLDGGIDSMDGYRSVLHGEAPAIMNCSSFSEEISMIIAYIDSLISGGTNEEAICISVRTNELVDRYRGALEAQGKEIYVVNTKDDLRKPGIRIATMHRVKGLEFNHMICPNVNKDTVPLKSVFHTQDNELAKEEFETKERSLFYVALTRARKSVLITFYDEPSEFIF